MPRPCQRRRASAVANRKSKSTKPEGPPPIRHKARQKAIHNARRGRGGGRGGRGGRGGGRGGQPQHGGDRFAQDRKMHTEQAELDFIPLSGGNNFEPLRRKREWTQSSPSVSTYSDSVSTYSDDFIETDSDELDDEDMEDTQDISINIDESLPTNTKIKKPRPTVMFTVPAAVAVYKEMYLSRFPLIAFTVRTHYGLFQEDTSPDSGAYISFASSAVSRRSSLSSTPSEKPTANEEAVPNLEAHNAARDYVFNWGVNSGKRFTDVDDKYLRTIGGQLYRYTGKHPGLLEAFEYHRPGQARLTPPEHTKPPHNHSNTGPAQSQPGRTKAKKPGKQTPSQPSSNNPSQAGTYRSHKRKREKKR